MSYGMPLVNPNQSGNAQTPSATNNAGGTSAQGLQMQGFYNVNGQGDVGSSHKKCKVGSAQIKERTT